MLQTNVVDINDPRLMLALEEFGEWMGKYNLTIRELMAVFASFLAFAAVDSGEPANFMKDFLDLLRISLKENGAIKV